MLLLKTNSQVLLRIVLRLFIYLLFWWVKDVNSALCAVLFSMGGDYMRDWGGLGGRVPPQKKKLLWDANASAPPPNNCYFY